MKRKLVHELEDQTTDKQNWDSDRRRDLPKRGELMSSEEESFEDKIEAKYLMAQGQYPVREPDLRDDPLVKAYAKEVLKRVLHDPMFKEMVARLRARLPTLQKDTEGRAQRAALEGIKFNLYPYAFTEYLRGTDVKISQKRG